MNGVADIPHLAEDFSEFFYAGLKFDQIAIRFLSVLSLCISFFAMLARMLAEISGFIKSQAWADVRPPLFASI